MARQLDNVGCGLGLLRFPLLGDSVSAFDTSDENVERHGAPDLNAAGYINKIDELPSAFNSGNIVAQKNGPAVQVLLPHATTPSRSDSERFESGRQGASLIKPVTGRVNLPTPANDNGGDTMPLEEAA